MDAPFFIVGASRSGTTMLRLLLNAHSRIVVPREFQYFGMVSRMTEVKDWRAVPEALYRQIVHRFLYERAYLFKEIDREVLEQDLLCHEPPNLRSPYQMVAEASARCHGKERWGEKTPNNLFYVDVLLDMFPEAKFVYLVRDPRAVVCSMNRIEYFSTDTVLNALNWYQATSSGYTLLEESVPAAQRITIRYEDLVQDTEEQLRILCDFIGEFFEPDMLAFYEDTEKHMGPGIRTPSVQEPVNVKSLEKWRSQLTASEIGIVESLCAKGMDRFGYKRTGLSPQLQDQVGKNVRLAYWKLQHWRHRQQRGYVVSHQMLGRTRKRLEHLLQRSD